jgi:methylated-DNA-[protein]-cysteine S-methyltransferase
VEIAVIVFGLVPAPFGELLVAKDGDAIVEIRFEHRHAERSEASRRRDPSPSARLRMTQDDDAIAEARAQLLAYFRGDRVTFDLRLAPRGTEFQQLVWRALQRIPYGQTRSYAEVAQEIGRAAAVRAVGAANGANPIPIVIPCHRVIGSNGSLTGFGGGIDKKRWLLAHEARVAGLRLF